MCEKVIHSEFLNRIRGEEMRDSSQKRGKINMLAMRGVEKGKGDNTIIVIHKYVDK